MCGENKQTGIFQKQKKGSPPRVRGKPCEYGICDECPGITPACAGKTNEVDDEVDDNEDHPRVCGENQSLVLVVTMIMGSPPRVRGKLSILAYEIGCRRITPACAGKT